MKRRLAMLAGAAMLSSLSVFAPASPASATATPDVCAGTGTAVLSGGLGYPVAPDGTLRPPNLRTFTFALTTGACATKAVPLGAKGHVHGWCGHSTGSGVTNNTPPASFHFISVGGTLVVFGHVVGVVNAIPTPGTGSCLDKAADRFTINGAVALQGLLLPGLPPTWNPLP